MRCYNEEGGLSLWRGNWANVVRYFPTQAINFSVKDSLNETFLHGIDPQQQKFKFILLSLLSGGLAGSVSLFVVYPIDFARTRLAADIGKDELQREFKGLWDCMVKINKKDGPVGLYQGFISSVIGIFIYRAFYFGGYDAGKSLIWGNKEEQDKASIFSKFLFAQLITSSSETLAYPFDTVRRRLMMESGKAQTDRLYKGTIHCTQHIWNHEGFPGFFKGNLSNVWRSVGSSLVLVLYDELQKILSKRGY